MKVNPNLAPVASKPNDASLTINNVFTLNLNGICNDPEGDELSYSVKFDGNPIGQYGGAMFNSETNTFTYNYQSFSYKGSY